MSNDQIDVRVLMAEIEAEARARRIGGQVPSDYEAELAAMFERIAPKTAQGDYEAAIRRAEEASMIDLAPPLQSGNPGRAFAKKGLAKLTSWYVRFVAQQVALFAANITEAVRALGERMRRIEAQHEGAASPSVQALARMLGPSDLATTWETHIEKCFAQRTGTICVAHAGAGALVKRLDGGARLAYGVEPTDPRRAADIDPEIDIRGEDVLTHLRSISGPALAGAVLVDVPDRLPIGSLFEAVDLCNGALLPDALLVIVTTDSRAWPEARGGFAADVSLGHPLAPATWVQLLTDRGFVDIDVVSETPESIVSPIAGTDPHVAELNAAFLALEAKLSSPASHCIVARKPA